MLIFSTIFLEVGIPTVETCTLEMWFFAIGIGLLLGTLSTTAVRGIKNTFVLAFSGCILIIEVIITGILTILDPPHKFLLDNGKGNRIFICLPRSGSALPAIIVLIIFNGSLMLFATYLAIRVRGVATAYNESKHILISVYNLNFAVIILLVLVFTSSSVIGVEPKFFLNSIVILITNLSIILNLFVPKIISVYQKTDQTKTQFSSSKSNEPNNLSGIVSSTVKGSSYNKSAADFTNIQAVWTKGSVVSNITAEWEIMNFSFIVLKERNFLWVQSQNSNSIAKSFMLDLNLTTGIRKKDGTPVLIIREKKSNSELKIRFNSQQEYDIFVDLLPPEVYHKSTAV
ncbi:hypothetical protein HDU92_005811 [Lobulomyces angularis]|nr:hypothetical protein HDU92_005811 [Lobulomyces angularis]